jgi:hypothetical protein
MYNTLQTRSDYCIPKMKLGGLVPNFHIPVSVCDLHIYSYAQSAYFAAAKKVDRSWEYINRFHTQECRNRERGRAVSFLGIFVSNFRDSVCSVYGTREVEHHC